MYVFVNVIFLFLVVNSILNYFLFFVDFFFIIIVYNLFVINFLDCFYNWLGKGIFFVVV